MFMINIKSINNIKKERNDNHNRDVAISFINISEKLKKSETFKECMKNLIPYFITWLVIGFIILLAL